MDSVRRTVAGVVEDFLHGDFYSTLDAVVFSGLGDKKPTYVSLRTTPNSASAVDEEARQIWFDIAPNDPYERQYQEDVLDYFFQENQANIAIMVVICIIAIILASLGLYGLLSFNIQRRLKEFSIRKVLGAGPKTIISIAGKQYLIIVLIAFVIGAPVGYMWINQLVTSIFPDPSATGPLPFIISISVVIVTLVLTIGGQIYQAMKVNPVDNLRHE
jgi:ABC-type antimicrobial peptide transport system permease subunit